MTKKHGSGGDSSGSGVNSSGSTVNKNDGKNNKCCQLKNKYLIFLFF